MYIKGVRPKIINTIKTDSLKYVKPIYAKFYKMYRNMLAHEKIKYAEKKEKKIAKYSKNKLIR